MRSPIRQCNLPAVVALVALSLSACNQRATPPAKETPTSPAPLTDEVRALLVQADAADGQVDRIVTKCITCGLGMNGKAAHAVTVEGYTVHLCAAACQTLFEKNPTAALLALKATEK